MTRLPALPLITCDPYFSVWMPADKLTDTDTAHWSKRPLPIYGRITVDGNTYRFLGSGNEPALDTRDISVTPCTTAALYEGGGIKLDVSFTTPILPDDLDRASTPITLIEVKAVSCDGKTHDVRAELAFSDKMCYFGDEKPEIHAYPLSYPGISMSAIGQINQKILSHSGDSVTIDWGYLYAAADRGEVAYDENCLTVRADASVNEDTACFRFLAGYDDVASILYYGIPCKAWYARKGKTFVDAMRETMNEFDDLLNRCASLDERIVKEAYEIGGEDYVLITSAAWRHVFAAHKLIADENGEMIFLSKENNSNGCLATVDVSYPSTPMFLKFCPQLVSAMCRPVLRFARMPVWSMYDFAPHDIGRYPIAGGQVYGNKGTMDVGRRPAYQPPFYLMSGETEQYDFKRQMPVEESGNMLIMMYAAAYFGDSTSLIKQNMDIAEKWVKYLIDYGEDPGNQLCTDDFAGHLAHNINLSAKAMVGVACYGRMLELIGKDGSAYKEKAKQMAKSWLKRAYSPDGTYLTFDGQGWSMKYNLAWDIALGLDLLDGEFYEFETRSYLKRINAYGLPLDNRAVYTKSDWELWTAAMAKDKSVREAIIAPVARYLRESESRIAFSDWYYTDSGKYVQFIARSVQGGLFMPFLCVKS